MEDAKIPFVDFVTFNHGKDAKDIIKEYNNYINKFNECKHCDVCKFYTYDKPKPRDKAHVVFKYCNGVKDIVENNLWNIYKKRLITNINCKPTYLSLLYKNGSDKYVHYLNDNYKDFRLKNVYLSDNIYIKKHTFNNVKDSIILNEDCKYEVRIEQYKKMDIVKGFDTEEEAFIFYSNYYQHPKITFTNEYIENIGGINKLIDLKNNGYFISGIEKDFNLPKSSIYHFLRKNNTKYTKL
jgi:hypothetical protein